jgi:ribosomal protein L16 Arg81 hydroxylase
MRVLLRAGDLLYIPCGYWHKAEAKGAGDPAISLAVGVMSRSAMDVYDFLRRRLVQSLVWRQRLPLVGPASGTLRAELEATYGHLFKQLADDLAKTFADPRLLSDFLKELTKPAVPETPDAGDKQ